MNKTPALLASALLSLSALSSAHAVNTVDLTVEGTIRPASCTPTLAAGGIVDFGVIAPSTLNATTPTPLGTQTVGLTVTCVGASSWALRGVDLRAASAGANADGLRFGLGQTTANEDIGSYTITLSDVQADGVAVRALRSNDNFATVTDHAGVSSLTGWASAAALPGTNLPVASQLTTANVDVEAFINPADGLTLTGDESLDGQATLELVYL